MKSASRTFLAAGKLGTFSGVFTPSILTILGIILFMRLGFVVGSAGFGKALIILALPNAISILTSISLSAIATNINVKVGGVYYLISRTLGVAFGGAIGIVLFLALSVSIAFYCIGFAESICLMLPAPQEMTSQILAAVAVCILCIFAWLGADWATRFQYVVMILLGLAIASFFTGGLLSWEAATFVQNWNAPPKALDFWVLFAIFFPAVTGFTQGVNMSGDLGDPGKSLPLGTFLAVGISILVYFAAAIVFAGVLPNQVLMEDYGAMKRVARFGWLVDAGVISATLSSAMASFLGAPRILQSLASDRIFRFLQPLAKGEGETGNPRRAVLLSAVIAFGTIGLGKLNLIAQVVSMFFLISYGLLNYATYYEARTASPSFRPRFRWYDYRLSLLGFLSCLGIMLTIDARNGLVAIAILFAVYQYLKRTAGFSRWADSRRSYHLKQARDHLMAADKEPVHPRDWRPQLLAFTNDSARRPQLLRFASWLTGGSGLITAVQLIEGEGIKGSKRRKEAEEALSADIIKNNLAAFPLVLSVPRPDAATSILAQAYGVGPVRANTALANWFDQRAKGVPGIEVIRFGQHVKSMHDAGSNVIVLHMDPSGYDNLMDPSLEKRRIDVWWKDNATGRLMLILAYLMTRSDLWEGADIQLIAEKAAGRTSESEATLKEMLDDFRVKATPVVLPKGDTDTIIEASADAAMVFLPFRMRNYRIVDSFGRSMARIAKNMPAVAMVMAAEDIELAAEPEDGAAGEIAAALDAVEAARTRSKAAKKEADAIRADVDKLNEQISDLMGGKETDAKADALLELKKAVVKTQETAERAFRREAKAWARVELAEKELQALGIHDADSDESEDSRQERQKKRG